MKRALTFEVVKIEHPQERYGDYATISVSRDQGPGRPKSAVGHLEIPILNLELWADVDHQSIKVGDQFSFAVSPLK